MTPTIAEAADRQQAAAPRPTDPRAARSRAAAMQAAQELLAEQGWAAVTHVAVAARSGVGRTTLYRHWPEAAGLIRDAIVDRICNARAVPTGDLHGDLVRGLIGLREVLHDPVSEIGMRAVIDRAGVDPSFAGLKATLYDEGSLILREVVEAAKSRGELPADLDTSTAVDELAGPLVFRRLLAGRTFGVSFVRRIVDDFLAAHQVR